MFDDLFGWLGSLLGTLKGFFQHVFDYIKRHVIPFIIARYRAIEDFLNRHLAPLLRFIQRVRAWYFQHIFPIQHAILEVIQRVRVALAVLRVLGFKWAAKLDADLQKIQSVVTASIVDVLKTLNTISSYIGMIVDPGMIIRRDFFRATLFSDLGGLKRAVAFGSNTPLSATQQQAESDDKGLLNPRTPFIFTDAQGHQRTSPAFDSIKANMQTAMRDYV